MPIDPKSQQVQDAMAAQSKDKTDDDTVKASYEHHKANPGPVIPENLPEKAGKDEVKKKAEELNK
ncbi:MAG: hypothetical protein M1820_002086 [Bogoriella megaspora]|nr:MAG: hypothetical protein M1820_002086 [Bogoriella megaspora]